MPDISKWMINCNFLKKVVWLLGDLPCHVTPWQLLTTASATHPYSTVPNFFSNLVSNLIFYF